MNYLKKLVLASILTFAVSVTASADCWVTDTTQYDGYSQETQWNSCTGDWFILTTFDDGSQFYWDSEGLIGN